MKTASIFRNLSSGFVVALLAVVSLVMNPHNVHGAVITDVSAGERAGMQMLYAVNDNNFDFTDAYTVDNSGSIAPGSFTRVAYYVQLGANWVWVSMDTFNANPTLLGVPKAGTGIVHNGTVVNNLNVETNHPSVTPVIGATGIIEFWASNYNQNGGGLFGSNNTQFDWKDSGGTTAFGHGSFQVFAFTDALLNSANTLFGVTRNGGSGIGDQIPLGSNGSRDWTFGPSAASYGIRNLEIWVGTPPPIVAAVPEPSTYALSLLVFAGIGLLSQRRKRREN